MKNERLNQRKNRKVTSMKEAKGDTDVNLKCQIKTNQGKWAVSHDG